MSNSSRGDVGSQASSANDFPVVEWQHERRFVQYLIGITVCLASVTALTGFSIEHGDIEYVGAAYNIDDNCVYYSWIRQAADGHFFIRNLFTTDPQNPIQFNLLMLSIGWLVRVSHLPIPLLVNIVRVVSAVFLLSLIYRLFRRLCPNNPFPRLIGLFFASLGSGFGFLFWPRWADKNALNLPVDTWQPEAFTFQSIEMSALFAVSQIFIVSVIYLLVVARDTGQMRYAAGAGLCALVLGNIHSYDVLHVASAWLLFLIVEGIIQRRFDSRAWLQAVVCGLLTIPSTAYQLHMFAVDPAFHARANDPTPSQPFQYYVLGYGVILILGVVAAVHMACTKLGEVGKCFYDRSIAILPACWFIAALAISYAPHVAFQRKMIMGADIPISLLAGYGLWVIIAKLTPASRSLAIALTALLCLPTTFLFVYRDLVHLSENRSETRLSPYLDTGEIDMLQWIRQNTAPNEAILGYPEFTIFIPGWCDRQTVVGHWGETPDFAHKYDVFQQFVRDGIPEQERADYLRRMNAKYLVFPNAANGISLDEQDGQRIAIQDFNALPRLLVPVHKNSELTIYRVNLSDYAE